jgi:RimJ/RimL family protein N-acetyltransferase
MELRRATVDEWEATRDIRLRSLREDPDAFCTLLASELEVEDQAWRDRVSRAVIFLAWKDGLAVGTAAGKPDPHEPGSREIVGMWVDRSVRREGVAADLIATVTDWAEDDGAQAIALWVAEDNESARRLYEKCGFVATGEHDAMRPGVKQLRMRKPFA